MVPVLLLDNACETRQKRALRRNGSLTWRLAATGCCGTAHGPISEDCRPKGRGIASNFGGCQGCAASNMCGSCLAAPHDIFFPSPSVEGTNSFLPSSHLTNQNPLQLESYHCLYFSRSRERHIEQKKPRIKLLLHRTGKFSSSREASSPRFPSVSLTFAVSLVLENVTAPSPQELRYKKTLATDFIPFRFFILHLILQSPFIAPLGDSLEKPKAY